MLNSLIFWKNWPAFQKVIFSLAALLFLGCVLATLFWFYNGVYNFISWDIASELDSRIIQKEVLSLGGLDFSLPQKLYFVKEFYLPSAIVIRDLPSIFLMLSLFVGMLLFLSGIANQKGPYFLAAILLTGLFVLLLRLENVFLTTNQFPFLAGFATLGGLLYYFSAFRPLMPFTTRFLSFLALLIVFSIAIFAFSKALKPFGAMAAFGFLFAIIVGLIFIFWVAQEILVGLIWMIGNSSIKGKSNRTPFIVIGIIYLLNCGLVYLENGRYIENSIAIVNPIYVLILSSILGLWSLKKYLNDTSIMSFQSTAAWVFLGLGIITFGGIGFAHITGNDPLIEFYDDYIAACHLVVAITFFIHVLINFGPLLKQGYNIHLVLWKAKISNIILARVGAILLLAFLLSQKNFYAFDQVMAGFQNAQADYYLSIGENKAAESFFKEAIVYDRYNHKANFGMASLSLAVNDKVNASYYFKEATFRNPSEFAYAGLSRSLEEETMFFDAIFALQEGLKEYPNSEVIATNLARLMERAQIKDSTLFYLDLAKKECYKCEVENTNLLSFWLKNGKKELLEKETANLSQEEYLSNQANVLALDRVLRDSSSTSVEHTNLPTALSVSRFANIYNAAYLRVPFSDSALTLMQQLGSNQVFARDITFVRALNSYNNGEKIDGIKKLTYLAVDSTAESIVFRKQLAIWYLQEGLYDRAINFFQSTGDLETIKALQQENFEKVLDDRAQLQAVKAGEITMENYKKKVSEAPFNPYLLQNVSDFLVSQNKSLDAYKLWLDATEFNDRSPIVWENFSLMALREGVRDYAQNGLAKLSQLVSPAAYNSFLEKYKKLELELNKGF